MNVQLNIQLSQGSAATNWEVVSFTPALCAVHIGIQQRKNYYKKLSYCWETVRRESMPRIAEMDVEMTT